MPPYPWLNDNTLDVSLTPGKIRAMQKLGVPYEEGYDQIAQQELATQAEQIATELQQAGIPITSDKEIIALIAYLQRLGTDIRATQK